LILFTRDDIWVCSKWGVINIFQGDSIKKVRIPFYFLNTQIFKLFLRILRLELKNIYVQGDILSYSFLGSFWFVSISSSTRYRFKEFKGKRPLKPGYDENGDVYIGEYFSNKKRNQEVGVFKFDKVNWQVKLFYFFFPGEIRHIHGVLVSSDKVYITCGDYGEEAKIVVLDKKGIKLNELIGKDQLHRTVAPIAHNNHLYYGTDTQIEQNYFCKIDIENQEVQLIVELDGPVFHTVKINNLLVFSSCVEMGLGELKKLTVYSYDLIDGEIDTLYTYSLPISLNRILQLLFGIPNIELFEYKGGLMIRNPFYYYLFSKTVQLKLFKTK